MTTTNYELQTPESLYVLIQHPTLSESVNVYAANRSDLETILDNLELAGVAEGRFFDDLEIQEDDLSSVVDHRLNQCIYVLELTKADLSLATTFEIMNFLGVVADG